MNEMRLQKSTRTEALSSVDTVGLSGPTFKKSPCNMISSLSQERPLAAVNLTCNEGANTEEQVPREMHNNC